MHLIRIGDGRRKKKREEQIITQKQMHKLPLIIGANYRKLSLYTRTTLVGVGDSRHRKVVELCCVQQPPVLDNQPIHLLSYYGK